MEGLLFGYELVVYLVEGWRWFRFSFVAFLHSWVSDEVRTGELMVQEALTDTCIIWLFWCFPVMEFC